MKIDKNKSTILLTVYSIVLNVMICLTFILIFPTLYSLPDEYEFTQLIVDGYYNISFSNFFLCKVIGTIQSIIYPLNAFVIIHLFFSIISFITISRVFLDKFSILYATCSTLLLSGFFAINHYVTISFSYLPTLLTLSGILSIIHYSKKDKWFFGVGLGTTLAVIGSMYRFQIFVVAFAVGVFYLLGHTISHYFVLSKKNRQAKKIILELLQIRRLIPGVLAIILAFSINIISNHVNTSTAELKYYKDYTDARSAVWDYPIPDYDVCSSDYDKIEIDANDIAMLREQYLDDEGAFPIDKLYSIKALKDQYNTDTKPFFRVITDMIVSEINTIKAQGDKGIASVAGIIVLLLFIAVMKKRQYFIPLFLLIITALVYIYLWIIGRPVYRALYMTWFGMVMLLLYSLSYTESKSYIHFLYSKHRKAFRILGAITCVVVAFCGMYFSNIGNFTYGYTQSGENDYNLINYFELNKEKKFEISRNSGFVYNLDKDIYHVRKRNREQNFLFNKGTYYKMPYYINVFSDFGTDNYYSNLLNDNVYFVDSSEGNDTKMMQNYLQKYYAKGDTIVSKTVHQISEFTIVKFERVK